MHYLFGLVIVLSISLYATIPNHPSNNEHPNTHTRATDSSEYIIEIDPDNSEAVNNATCLPKIPNQPSTVPCKTLDFAFQQVYNFASVSSITYILLPDSTYTLNSVSTFQNLKYPIRIIANQPVVVQCTAPKSSGLVFLHSSNITIQYIRFYWLWSSAEQHQ